MFLTDFNLRKEEKSKLKFLGDRTAGNSHSVIFILFYLFTGKNYTLLYLKKIYINILIFFLEKFKKKVLVTIL